MRNEVRWEGACGETARTRVKESDKKVGRNWQRDRQTERERSKEVCSGEKINDGENRKYEEDGAKVRRGRDREKE